MGAGSTGPQAQCQSKVALETVLSHAQSLQAMKNMGEHRLTLSAGAPCVAVTRTHWSRCSTRQEPPSTAGCSPLSAARLAVYNVAYLRQLYPSDCFMSRELPDSDGLL